MVTAFSVDSYEDLENLLISCGVSIDEVLDALTEYEITRIKIEDSLIREYGEESYV